MADSFSWRNESNACVVSLTLGGVLKFLMRTLDDASSIRSIALSGRWRSGIYLVASAAAAVMASSLIVSW
jgi:cyanophycinase-like exopeptidase